MGLTSTGFSPVSGLLIAMIGTISAVRQIPENPFNTENRHNPHTHCSVSGREMPITQNRKGRKDR